MAEFYDEIFDDKKIDFDVDIIYPDGSKEEMYLDNIPSRGEMMLGYIVNKILLYEKNKENECEARIELIRKKDYKK